LNAPDYTGENSAINPYEMMGGGVVTPKKLNWERQNTDVVVIGAEVTTPIPTFPRLSPGCTRVIIPCLTGLQTERRWKGNSGNRGADASVLECTPSGFEPPASAF
jgi:hypothetical protein